MKAVIVVSILLSLGCVKAIPTYTAIGASSTSAAASSSAYSASSLSTSFNYYSSEVCTAVGFTIRDDLATCIFDQLEQQFLEKKCELLNSYGVYPRDIGNLFSDLSPESLHYDIIVIGSGAAGLSALAPLAALGKKILIVDKGYFPSAAADSLYYRSTLYSSEYVNSFPGYINGVEVTKNLYTSNVFGGLSVLDTNAWNIGSSCLYDQLSKLDQEFAWEKIQSYYKSLESYKTYSRSVSVTTSTSTSASSSSSVAASSSGGSSSAAVSSASTSTQTTTSTYTYEYSTEGTYSIYNSFKETFLTRTLSSVFDELGYCNSDTPFSLQPNKYTILPILGDGEKPTLFPYTVFSALEQYKNNIDLALKTTVDKIIFDCKKATGVEVTTPCGQKLTLYANDQVILSTGPISTYQLLFNSGVGPEDLLAKYNIPVNFAIPSMGNGLILPPIHHGICLKFPKGYLINDYDSDLRNLAYAFGDYDLSPTTSLSYYRAYLAVKEATEANVALKFYAFSQSTSIRLNSMMTSYFQYDSYTQEYINSLIKDYDILIVGTQLLAPRSRGFITYKDSIEKPYIDLGMFSDNYDIECMLEAIDQVRALAQTKAFLDLSGELVQLPLQNISGDFFTPEFNKQSILYHSVPSLYPSGGFPIGIDYQTAVVDRALRVLGTDNLHLLSPCASPYPLYSDSLAFSTFIGYYGAQVIVNEYNGIVLDSIQITSSSSSTSISSSGAISTSQGAASYASRDISATAAHTSVDIDSATGLDSSLVVDSATGSSSSAAQYSHSSTNASGSYAENDLSYDASCTDNDLDYNAISHESSASSSSSSYNASQSGSSSVIGSNGVVSQQSYSANNSSSDYQAKQSSSSTVMGANGAISQESSSASYGAQNSSSKVAGSSYSAGGGAVQASSYEAASESSSAYAEQEYSSISAY